MRILKTAVTFDDDSDLYYADSIEHDGQVWLVPEWIDAPGQGWKKPKRLICLNTMAHERMETGDGGDFVVTWPIPRSVFDGRVPEGAGTRYIIIEGPDIRVPVAGKDR